MNEQEQINSANRIMEMQTAVMREDLREWVNLLLGHRAYFNLDDGCSQREMRKRFGKILTRTGVLEEKLRWILTATPEDVEQWRNGEEAARFVHTFSITSPRCLECDQPLTNSDPPETDKCKSCYEDYER